MKVKLIRGTSPTCNTLQIDDLTLLFSYTTIVAFSTPETGWIVSENVWTQTTGKHLRHNAPRVPRTPYGEFQHQLEAVLTRHTPPVVEPV